ncbi:MAG: glutaredoxin domain-containing protein, partial [Candidatus Methylomirabilales bacterium]
MAAKEFLKAKGIPFTDINVVEDKAAREEMVKKSGQMGVPVIEVDGEIVVGFELGYFEKRQTGHASDYSRPAEHVLARSLDGGETWALERPEGLRPPPGEKVAGVPTGAEGRQPVDCPGGIDFTHPDFALTARMTSIHAGNSRFYYSYDRGRSWQGPFRLPNFGQPGTAA